MKAIFNYRKHPSIEAIKNITAGKKFSFLKVSIEVVMTEIKKLNTRKATQSTDIKNQNKSKLKSKH